MTPRQMITHDITRLTVMLIYEGNTVCAYYNDSHTGYETGLVKARYFYIIGNSSELPMI